MIQGNQVQQHSLVKLIVCFILKFHRYLVIKFQSRVRIAPDS
jgi:hypothetical protein